MYVLWKAKYQSTRVVSEFTGRSIKAQRLGISEEILAANALCHKHSQPDALPDLQVLSVQVQRPPALLRADAPLLHPPPPRCGW